MKTFKSIVLAIIISTTFIGCNFSTVSNKVNETYQQAMYAKSLLSVEESYESVVEILSRYQGLFTKEEKTDLVISRSYFDEIKATLDEIKEADPEDFLNMDVFYNRLYVSWMNLRTVYDDTYFVVAVKFDMMDPEDVRKLKKFDNEVRTINEYVYKLIETDSFDSVKKAVDIMLKVVKIGIGINETLSATVGFDIKEHI